MEFWICDFVFVLMAVWIRGRGLRYFVLVVVVRWRHWNGEGEEQTERGICVRA